MRKAIPILLALATLGAAGCDDTTAPRDVTPPQAPRGVFSVTGDGQAKLQWLANTEADLAGYRVYESPCASGPNCPYDRVGATTDTKFAVSGLTNGVTRFFAVSAVDRAGNESPLSPENVFDTPRPAGTATLANFVTNSAGAGWNFAAASVRASDDLTTDIYFGDNGSVSQMFATNSNNSTEPNTEIQDAGYATTLDAVDFAPNNGWSPTGTVEMIPGHCYIVWTKDDHYAKFRVIGLSHSQVGLEWAYQTAPGNPELHARPARQEPGTPRALAWLR